ncbi:MAG: polysaccharide pyruvyl transferase family protein [Gemmatimonadetes bacterium]|nr:polysaccharide pyruvyl transferase family protein [Gemmatimonadota bacterium]
MRKPARVGLITTLDTNIGDDFIREGVKRVVAAALDGREIEWVMVNKHHPLTVYPGWHPVRLAERLPRGRGKAQRLARTLLHPLPLSRFDGCELVVQCGAPVLWPGCHGSEWAEPLWREVVGRLAARGVPVLNLAAGSCYPWESPAERIDDAADVEYVRRALADCRLTTSRDTLAHRLYASVGGDTPLVRCTAFVAPRGQATDRDERLVLVNYMAGAGHYDWGQGVDGGGWEATMKTVLERLKERHRVAFLCHTQAEYDLAGGLDPSLPRILPRTPREYFEVAARAAGAVCNRLHASVAMAGMGIPSVAIGTDTRLLMVEQVGIPALYVKEATAERVLHELDAGMARAGQTRDRLLAASDETWDAYVTAIRGAIGPRAAA